MSINSRGQCLKCGSTFSIFTDELKILPGMKIGDNGRLNPKKILKTWTDWVEHAASHCPDCRIRVIPPDCLQDYERKKRIYQSRQF